MILCNIIKEKEKIIYQFNNDIYNSKLQDELTSIDNNLIYDANNTIILKNQYQYESSYIIWIKSKIIELLKINNPIYREYLTEKDLEEIMMNKNVYIYKLNGEKNKQPSTIYFYKEIYDINKNIVYAYYEAANQRFSIIKNSDSPNNHKYISIPIKREDSFTLKFITKNKGFKAYTAKRKEVPTFIIEE